MLRLIVVSWHMEFSWFLECKGSRYIKQRVGLCVCVCVCVYNILQCICNLVLYEMCNDYCAPLIQVSNVIRFVFFSACLNHRIFMWIDCFIFTSYGPTTCFQCKLHLTSCNIIFSLFYCFKLLCLQYFCKIRLSWFYFF